MVTAHTIRHIWKIARQDGDFFNQIDAATNHDICDLSKGLNAMHMATGNKTKGMCDFSHIPLPFCHSEK